MALLYIVAVLVLLFAVLLFLICPSFVKNKDTKILEGSFIAHRGLHDIESGIPENSVLAFKRAIGYGYIIETDIHLTSDGEVIVFHDNSFARMCGLNKSPEEMTLKEIKQLRLLNTDETVPTLKECLDTVCGRVPILIEFKCSSPALSVSLCEKADEILSGYDGKYFVQSFYPFAMKWYRKHRPNICRGQLASEFKGKDFSKRISGTLFANVMSRPHFISYEYKYDKNIFLRFCVMLGALPICWTVRSKEKLERAKKFFRAYIFEKFIP